MVIILIGCTNKDYQEKWNALKKEKKFDNLLIFASDNLENSFLDSAITYLSDTSFKYVTHGIIIKDSIDIKSNQKVIYSDFEYGCVAPIPPFKDRVAFRIQIKDNDSILVNNALCKQEKIEERLINFVLNSNNLDGLPPKRIEKNKEWGDIEVTIAVVEIYCNLNDLGYKKNYIEKKVQLMSITYDGYNHIRNVKSKEIFNRSFSELNPKEKDLIRKMHPLRLYIKNEDYKKINSGHQLPTNLKDVLMIDN